MRREAYPVSIGVRDGATMIRQWLRRRGRLVLSVTAASYVLACVGIYLGERRITYQIAPTRTNPTDVRLDSVVEQQLVTPDGQRLVVWRLKGRHGQPTLLYFHGNGDPLTYRSGRVASFEAEGYGVYMMAYRGYSGSSGQPSETANVGDGVLAYDTLTREGLVPQQIVIYGESLGTSVALQVALRREASALILEAPFTSMVDAWRQFVPLLPVRQLLRDQYNSLAVIGQLRMPLLVMHGRRDRLVSFRLGHTLYEAAPEPKRFEVFPEAAHTNLYDYNAISAVRRFLVDVSAGQHAISNKPDRR